MGKRTRRQRTMPSATATASARRRPRAAPRANTALHAASSNGHAGVIDLLLAKGAHVNARGDAGWTALHWAGCNGHLAAVEALVAGGADLKARNHAGATPLDVAVGGGRQAVVDLLESVDPEEPTEPAQPPEGRREAVVSPANETATASWDDHVWEKKAFCFGNASIDESRPGTPRSYSDTEKQQRKVSVICFDVRNGRGDRLDMPSSSSLEELVRQFTQKTTLTYQSLYIVHEGRMISYASSRLDTLMALGIDGCDVLNMKDVWPEKFDSHQRPTGSKTEVFDQAWREGILLKLKHSIQPSCTSHTHKASHMFYTMMAKPLDTNDVKTLSADTVELFLGPCEDFYQLAKEKVVDDHLGAKKLVVMAFFIERLFLAYVTGRRGKEVNLFTDERMKLADSRSDLENFLQSDSYRCHLDRLNSFQLQKRIYVALRFKADSTQEVNNVNPLISLNQFIKKYAMKCGSSAQSLRFFHKEQRLFVSSLGKKSLDALGITNGDVIEVEEVIEFSETANLTAGDTNRLKKDKSLKIVANQRHNRRTQIVIPKTINDLRIEHSKKFSSILEEAELKHLRQIRLRFNNLAIKRMSPRRQENLMPRVVIPNESQAVPNREVGGKAGKHVYPVIIGSKEHLYKSSKKSAMPLRKQTTRAIDLHGCTIDEAIVMLDKRPAKIEEDAMKEDNYTLHADIVCGGGNQILSELVESWIRKTSHVANRPKGSI